MNNTSKIALILATSLFANSPLLAQDKKDAMDSGAKGGAIAGGAAGAVGGAIVGGPVGAVVGGAIGAAAGATSGAVTAGITAEDKVYVRKYVETRPIPPVRYEGEVVVGATLPGTVTYYRIEDNPRFEAYRYTHVNGKYVMVDDSNRVVTVIN